MVFLAHRRQIENHEKINGSEFAVNCRRTADFYAHFQINIEKARQLDMIGFGKKIVDWKGAFPTRFDTNCWVKMTFALKLLKNFRPDCAILREN